MTRKRFYCKSIRITTSSKLSDSLGAKCPIICTITTSTVRFFQISWFNTNTHNLRRIWQNGWPPAEWYGVSSETSQLLKHSIWSRKPELNLIWNRRLAQTWWSLMLQKFQRVSIALISKLKMTATTTRALCLTSKTSWLTSPTRRDLWWLNWLFSSWMSQPSISSGQLSSSATSSSRGMLTSVMSTVSDSAFSPLRRAAVTSATVSTLT